MYGETFYGRHTAQHRLKQSKIKVKKDCLWIQRTYKITKIGDSVRLSLFICNTAVYEAAYSPSVGLSGIQFQNNQDGLNDPRGNII